MPTISTKWENVGDKEYREALKQMQAGMNVTRSEAKLLSAQFADNEETLEAVTKKNEILDRTGAELTEQLELQEARLQALGKAYGAADERTLRMQKTVNETRAALVKTEKELKNNEEQLQEFGKRAEETGNETIGLGDAINNLSGKFGIDLPDGIKESLNGFAEINTKTAATVAAVAAVTAAVVKLEKELISLAVDQAEWAKEVDNSSAQLNMSTETYQQLDHVMKSVGFSMDQAKGDISALAEKAQDAAAGSGEAAEMFDALGVSVTNVDGTMKSQTQLFAEVYSALAQMSDITERNAIASKLLSTTGEEAVIPMLEKYGAALGSVAAAAPIVSDEDVQKLSSLSAELGAFESTVNAAKSTIAAEFAPSLEQALQVVGDLATEFAEFATETGLVEMLGKVLEVAANLLQVLEPLVEILGILKPAFEAINGVLSMIADAVNIAANAVGVLVDALEYLFSFGNKPFDTSHIENIANVVNGTNSSTMRWAMGNVGHNAGGTDNWRGGLTWVGESGPELVNLPKGSQVFNHQASLGMSGDVFNITIEARHIQELQNIVDIANNYRRSMRMGYGG